MGIVLVLAAAAVSVVLGFILGSTPGLNEHLHWNLWYIVPASGLLFGALCGFLHFRLLLLGHQRATWVIQLILILASVCGYLAVDFGIYRATEIQITDEEYKINSYPFRDLMSFEQYLKMKLGSTHIELSNGNELEFESASSGLSFVVDLLGVALGTFGLLLAGCEMSPYCLPCKKYKKQQQRYQFEFTYQEELLKTILSRLQELGRAGVSREITAYCAEQAQQYKSQDGDTRIRIDQKACPVCTETTFIGSVWRKNSKEWAEVDELKFRFTSKPQGQAGQTIAEGTTFMRGVQ
jgi:hypothetical protein